MKVLFVISLKWGYLWEILPTVANASETAIKGEANTICKKALYVCGAHSMIARTMSLYCYARPEKVSSVKLVPIAFRYLEQSFHSYDSA